MSIEKSKDNNLQTYLPLSEQCLKPRFLANDQALNTFVRLAKESHETNNQNPFMLSAYDFHKKSFTEIFSEMRGLTEDQKAKATQVAKDIEKQPVRKKLECQF